MSWGITVESKIGRVRAEVNQFLAEAKQRGTSAQFESVEAKEQIDAGIRAAEAILLSRSVQPRSHPEISVRVRLNGHANPNHEPASGWSNDYVSVEVTQLAS